MLKNEIKDTIINIENKNGTKLIKKKIILPFNEKTLLSQHNYINYLYSKKINVAKITKLFKIDNYFYECQEYIENNKKDYKINGLIKALAIFHNESSKYRKSLNKKNVYDFDFFCKQNKLHHLLLGYSEKYQIYPLQNYLKNKKYIDISNIEISEKIISFYKKSYEYILKNHNIKSCIIHNDITKNNVINNKNGLYLIDFDLCTYSLELVDIVDAIMIPYDNLESIIASIDKWDTNFIRYIVTYNKYNHNIKINIKDIYYQIILKLVSFNYYVILNESSKKEFNQNIKYLYIVIEKIKEKIENVDC